ncbi:hypothetical protein SBA5_580041 [Candidatus Sulfotelmatomonas gaucii]|uniref:Uncharacterized protein n=1 Tax=Candidatus Sulfuritelmatomonas gaucii TaxID=2043161 RepID=A0A2N9LVA0_9BACT|nr:hypothetical protein SBA5_580041 [Candidatus Sulfotelmatomonas gaucii]
MGGRQLSQAREFISIRLDGELKAELQQAAEEGGTSASGGGGEALIVQFLPVTVGIRVGRVPQSRFNA